MWGGMIPPVKRINRIAPVEVSQRFGEPREKAKRKRTTMKKLMIVAAAAAMTFASEAKLQPQECLNCGGGSDSTCDVVVFKVTGSGKAVVAKDDYKEVKSLKIKKGALALTGELCEETGACCYSEGYLFAKIKAGKASFDLASTVELGVWSIFGKNLDKIRAKDVKPGKTYKLDSALYISSAAGDTEVEGETAVEADSIEFYASAFGKVNVKISKGTSGTCNPQDPCDPTYTPKSYSGWFVGKYACLGEEDCFLCDCADTDVFGGTWKATYKSSAKSVEAAARLAGVAIEDDDDE